MTTRPWLADGDVELYLGNVEAVLRSLADESVQTVVTSPPYYGLRDYGTGSWAGGDADCDHSVGRGSNVRQTKHPNADGYPASAPHRGGSGRTCSRCGARRVDDQLGLESSPAEYVERLVGVFREVRRVLRRDGTVWLNLGDSYASGGAGGASPASTLTGGGGRYRDGSKLEAMHDGPDMHRSPPPGLKPKDLVGIPWRVAFALQADGWYLRSDVIWSKPNPMPESVVDRPTKAHEYLFLLSRSQRYFYDAAAVTEPLAGDSFARSRRGSRYDDAATRAAVPYAAPRPRVRSGNKERKHGAEVGAPDARPGDLGRSVPWEDDGSGRNLRSVWTIATEPVADAHFATFPRALVEPCVRAGSRIGDAVLDPFAGSGTTLLVARRLGRRGVGIDLSESYLRIAAKRLASPELEHVAPASDIVQLSLLAAPRD